ncbi:hypothetical protein C0J52_16940 [Blattella germanica]|nr:hypothetical protein C0J52_16940 [Blattella germanica]
MKFNQPRLRTAVSFFLLVAILDSACSVPAVAFPGKNFEENEVESGRNRPGEGSNWNVLMRVLEDCAEKDLVQCIGIKTITAMDRAARMADIQVLDGVSLIKNGEVEDARDGRALMSEDEIQNSLEQDPSQKTSRLVEYLVRAAARFLNTHVLQFKLPEFEPEQVQRALSEARGKKKMLKALLPIIMGVAAKLALVIPLGLGLIGFLALKALLVSKVALILAGVVALQKLFGGGGLGGLGGGKNGWSSGGNSGWSTGGVGGGWSNGGASGGWSTSGSGGSSAGYYRSFDASAPVDAHDMAYKAQIPLTNAQ